jgi:hypothetical protein
MAYEPSRGMHLKYNQRRGYWNFVLYLEPGVVTAAFNGAQIIEEPVTPREPVSPYAVEWLRNLVRCEPDALHVAVVGSKDAARLWHSCYVDDSESPAVIAGDGCLCWQAFRDPATQMPVAAEHFRTVTGNIEHWRYYTFAPLELPDGEKLERIIIDREAGVFWIRAVSSALYLFPEERGSGYEIGYGGGGPAELARFIVKIVQSDGYDLSAGTTHEEHYNAFVDDWAGDGASNYTQELTLEQLRILCRKGVVP